MQHQSLHRFWQSYGQSLILITGIVTGGVLGFFVPSVVPYLTTVGAIFLNMIFVLVVPLIFLSMSHAIYNLSVQSSVGRILGRTMLVFVLLALITALIAYVGCRLCRPLPEGIATMTDHVAKQGYKSDLVVSLFSVPEFYMLLGKSNLLPLLIMSILTGLACGRIGDRAEPVIRIMDSAYEVVMQLFELIMLFAPIGLGCYFSGVISQLGGDLLEGYLRSIVLYLILLAIVFVLIDPLIVRLRCGKGGLRSYLRCMFKPGLAAVATCSSSACIPVTIQASKESGVNHSIAETVIPLGTNIFKQASVAEGVIKVCFALILSGQMLEGWSSFFTIIFLGILASIIITAVPSGGMASEAVICSIMGVSPEIVGVMVIFATIIDMPSTFGNVVGNYTAATLVDSVPKSSLQQDR